MSTGVAYGGNCYATPESAVEAFTAAFPTVEGGSIMTLDNVMLAGNVVSYTILTKPPTSNTTYTRTGSFEMNACEMVNSSMVDNMAGLAFAMLFAFFFAFFSRKAIRKFVSFAGGFSNDF